MTARNEQPEPKLPLKGVVCASGKELFGKGRAVLDVSAVKADEAKVEPGPYQVLMVVRKSPNEAQEQHMLLRGNWIQRGRNTTPVGIPYTEGFTLGFDEDKSELYVATKKNVKTKDTSLSSGLLTKKLGKSPVVTVLCPQVRAFEW